VVVGTVTPVGGPPSLYVYVRALGRRGVPTDDALVAAALRSAVGYAAFLLLLVPALALHRPSAPVVAAAGVLTALFVAMALGLRLVLRGGDPSVRWARWAPNRVVAFLARARSHGVRPADLARPLGLTFGVKLAGAAMLYAGLRAVGERPPPAAALVAYAVGVLCLTAAPLFGGIGVVEVAMAVTLGQLGVPGEAALGAALLCRLGELWLPLTLGLAVQAVGVVRRPVDAPVAIPVPALSGGPQVVPGHLGMLLPVVTAARPRVAGGAGVDRRW
jgi:uncharacterized membrane protein YbhN (UPF0104 family)